MAKRRTFTAEFKARVVLEALSGVKSAAEICREHNIKPQLLSRWKAEFLENAPKVFEPEERRSDDRARIRELERLLGQKTVELEITKKASNILTAHQYRSRKSS
jgi:transposase-like protein